MPRRALVVLFLLTWVGIRPAAARTDDAADARALLETIATSASKEERLAAAQKLADLGGRVIEPLAEFLKRPHATTDDQRRAVLAAIKASVPDKNGRFTSPGRQKAEQIRADDAFDWLAALADLPPDPALAPAVSEVIADVAAIRALAASRRVEAAHVILDAGFGAETMVYRDECGRQLRKMAPYSLPALILGSQAKRAKARARYSNYQLERLDRQDPAKAILAGEDDEDLQIAILQAYGKTEYREAVAAVFKRINDDAPRVRAAARAAWLEYVKPPHPPEPPKKKLQMTGGALSEEEQPLWLNSLDLARHRLELATEELWGETLAPRAKLVEASERIFAHYDNERAARDATVIADGKAKAEAGDLAGAIAIFDRLVAENPERPERGELVPYYLRWAEELAEAGTWREASAMYSKAHGLAPDGERATDALAAHYYALGKAQEAEGKDGGAAYRRAVELRPDYAEAKQAAEAAAGGGARRTWILYLAGVAAIGAAVLLGLGLRSRTWR